MERTIPYPGGRDIAASRDFYVGALGFEVVVEEPALCLGSPGNPAACARPARGLRVAYPLTDEPWGVRRFFVEDPGGTILNLLAHLA